MNRFYTFLILTALFTGVQAQIPILNSNPSATNKVIYLDFDGQKVSGTSWNNGGTINAQASNSSYAAKIQIWKRVSEDYRPFDVNVTTDSNMFNNALPNRRMRVIFTPTSSWYGSAGGVAYVGSFAWGGTPGTPCWVFENQLGTNTKNMAEAAAHEVGHTLSLRHQSTYNSSCQKTNEYHPGVGTGVTSWAPIMGVGYSKNVTIWHSGPNALGCNNIQNDHSSAGITGFNYLSFLPDDVGNDLANAKSLNLFSTFTTDSGLITQPSDIDAFKFTICEPRYVSVNAKPFALDTNNYSGANLDIRLHIYDASHNLLAVDTTLTRLDAKRGLNLTPGTYYFTIDGGGSNNYTDYGSLGRYYLYIKATNPPPVSAQLSGTTICAAQTLTLSATPVGPVQNWFWSVTGSTSFTSTAAAPVQNLSPGNYTVTLLTSNGSYTGCPVTTTVQVASVPAVSISGNTLICAPQTVNLTASGAITYTWVPGNTTGPAKAVTASLPLNYTVTGSNGICSNTAAVSLSVNPSFSVNLSASKTNICLGDTVVFTASGANAYTLSPGSIQGNSVALTPGISANYFLTGEIGPCQQTDQVTIIVNQPFPLSILPSTEFACEGDTIQISATGATSYTFEPGGQVTNPAQYIIFQNTIYTVTAAHAPNCPQKATAMVQVLVCNLDVSLPENNFGELAMFPNPAFNEITFKGVKNGRLKITNVHGAVIYSSASTAETTKIACGNWARGLYFVQMVDDAGHQTTRRLLLE